MAPVIELLDSDFENVQLGEGPHWDADTQSLYFVDIFGHYIHKYVPSTNKHTKAHIGVEKTVSLIIPVKGKNDQFVVSIGREIALVTWDGENENISKVEKLYEVDENLNTVFNDGKCDPYGRLWAGTMAQIGHRALSEDGIGSLYSFQNKKITKHTSEVKLTNGLAFDTDRKKFYYVDSLRNTIDEYDFDIELGAISNRKTIFTFNGSAENYEVLDGMTIDTDGNLWVAVFSLSQIIKIDPRKPDTIQDTIQLPSIQTASLAFGGPNLDELYVTTAKIQLKGEIAVLKDVEGGGIYRITGLNAKGLPGVRVVL